MMDWWHCANIKPEILVMFSVDGIVLIILSFFKSFPVRSKEDPAGQAIGKPTNCHLHQE